MSFLIKNLRILNFLRHAYITKQTYSLSALNNIRSRLLINFGGPVLSRSMAHEAIRNIGVEELRNYQNTGILIIDVREKNEIAETGVLPGGINIPLGEVVDALSKSPEEFQCEFGKPKPEKNDCIIFSCRSGKRSSMAAQKVAQLGFNNVINFQGGWLEWERSTQSSSHSDT